MCHDQILLLKERAFVLSKRKTYGDHMIPLHRRLRLKHLTKWLPIRRLVTGQQHHLVLKEAKHVLLGHQTIKHRKDEARKTEDGKN